jgi:hypothetical protein
MAEPFPIVIASIGGGSPASLVIVAVNDAFALFWQDAARRRN